jgi:class 3 adenylate cyclase
MSGEDVRQRLAAILAADAVGYSRLMEADERTTMAALDAARDVFRAQVASNHVTSSTWPATPYSPCSIPRPGR